MQDYYWAEVNDDANENNDAGNYWINNIKTTASKPSEYKTKIIGSTTANKHELDTDVNVELHYLNNVWRSLDLSLINCKIEFNFF